jgi:alcohol dehydrogenase class IV
MLEVEIADRCQAIKQALGLDPGASLSDHIRSLLHTLDLPTSLTAAGFKLSDLDGLALTCSESHFNRTSRVTFRPADFSKMVQSIL